VAVLQRRMILRLPETQRCRDACGSGLHGIRADPSAAQELPRAFERPEPFLERRQDSDDDVLLCPEGGRSIWRLFAKPKQARNFKGLKHLKCRYTFRIGAQVLPRRRTDYSELDDAVLVNRWLDLGNAQESRVLSEEAAQQKMESMGKK
jgi:hypothetical protein